MGRMIMEDITKEICNVCPDAGPLPTGEAVLTFCRKVLFNLGDSSENY